MGALPVLTVLLGLSACGYTGEVPSPTQQIPSPALTAAPAAVPTAPAPSGTGGGGGETPDPGSCLEPLDRYFQGLNAGDLQRMSSAFLEPAGADFYASRMEGYDREADYWQAHRAGQSALYKLEDGSALQYSYAVEGQTVLENLPELEEQFASKYGETCTISEGYEVHFFQDVSDGTNSGGTSGLYFDVILVDGTWYLFW